MMLLLNSPNRAAFCYSFCLPIERDRLTRLYLPRNCSLKFLSKPLPTLTNPLTAASVDTRQHLVSLRHSSIVAGEALASNAAVLAYQQWMISPATI
jgi:hypothetical protein